jgi:hypothetical protein
MSESSAASTTYIVLQRVVEADSSQPMPGPLWYVADPAVPAASAEAAIRATAKDGGVYVAVPGRSFKPVRVEAVQVTSLKLEAAE